MPSSPNPPDPTIAVAVPVPGLGLLSYRVPGRPAPPKGARVRVPLGSRTVVGCVVEPDAAAPADVTTLRDVVAVLDDEPFLPPSVVDLAVWVGEYYASGPGDPLAMAMPPAARRGEHAAFRTVRVVELADDAPDVSSLRGPRQRAVVERLRAQSGGVAAAALAQEGVGADVIARLVRLGFVRIREDVVERDPFGVATTGQGGWSAAPASDAGRTLTAEQHAALDALQIAADARAFRTTLLHGVTGSGKTEVFLRLAQHVLAAGRRVLVLVPEIALTPSVAGLMRATFGERVAIQHSGLSDGERHDQWHRIRRGDVDVVVGTRSAVFAPIEQIGLIVVDEEHDAAYKQEEAPRYHGRDVAVMRGRMQHALVVLASATPSLESAVNAETGRYDLLRLTRRVLNRPLAEVHVVDMRRELAARGPEATLSAALLEGIAARLERHEQSLVLLNRRGYAPVIFCRECGATVECPHCSVTLTYHRAARRMRCHYCNFSSAVPGKCASCGGAYLERSGIGTERLEADLRAEFPQARIARVDRDTVRRRGAVARVLADVARGEIDILVGTQMIAKGHDFPAVTLAGVVAADVGLGRADFRVGERTFQLLTQVVGRAGRGAIAGEAIVQTLYPDHYSIQAAAAQDYAAFFAREMEFRRAMHYPPDVALINVVVKGRSLATALEDARDLVGRIRGRAAGQVLGPAPAPREKIKDEFRAQFFVKGTRRRAMREAVLAALAARPDLRRRTIVDIDPVSVT
ncbi:MAG TPA: primosomal protein N' [Vicinamibacterales bacterium]|nr:primosomal protein N' [Vicinamibacterales bacterium]